MNIRTTIAIGGLLVVVVGLGVALGVALATGDAEGSNGTGHRMESDSGDGFMGMMDAMGDMDSGTFAEHMRDVLGDDGFGRMLDHMREHRDGGPMTGDPAINDMIQMMDGMMEHMQADTDGLMPGHPDTHHQTPAP